MCHNQYYSKNSFPKEIRTIKFNYTSRLFLKFLPLNRSSAQRTLIVKLLVKNLFPSKPLNRMLSRKHTINIALSFKFTTCIKKKIFHVFNVLFFCKDIDSFLICFIFSFNYSKTESLKREIKIFIWRIPARLATSVEEFRGWNPLSKSWCCLIETALSCQDFNTF